MFAPIAYFLPDKKSDLYLVDNKSSLSQLMLMITCKFMLS